MRLRGLRDGDAEFLAALDADEFVMHYVHDGAQPLGTALEFARMQVEMAKHRHYWGKWMAELKDTRVAIGWIELHRLRGEECDDLQLGYEFHPDYWNNGYATEAIRRIVEYGFAGLELERMAALVQNGNTASVRVLEKNGFRMTCTRETAGRQVDEYWITAEEWQATRSAGTPNDSI